MQNAEVAPMTAETMAETYDRQGFIFPVDVVSVSEAQAIRADLEAAEAECADDREKLNLVRSYPDRLLPSFDALSRHPNLIAAVSQILGDDLMVWSGALFIKEANTSQIVSWHQDLTYWGLDDAEEVNKKKGTRKTVGRILLKGDNITMMVNTSK